MRDSATSKEARERSLWRAVLTFIATGVFFVLLPGTFLGVWNLISISSRRQLDSLSPAWVQAHGHAQIFGWIGSFVIGIGYFSLSKMGRLPDFAARRAWTSYALWTAGVALRWASGVTGWQWRLALPVSALLELGGFIVFLRTVSGHKLASTHTPHAQEPKPAWMRVVVAATFGFLATLWVNAIAMFYVAATAAEPAIPHAMDQRLLVLPIWGFLVPTVWGFNARWLSGFIGLRKPRGRELFAALALAWAGVVFEALGMALTAAFLFVAAALAAIFALRIFEPVARLMLQTRVPQSFGLFVRLTYAWLAIATVLTVWAAAADHGGGIWGASRHALTVGYLAAMVFAIGPKILPAFAGGRELFSTRAMFVSLALLNLGCTLRVVSEIPAYEAFRFAPFFWRVLPVSAVIELTAVTVFAANLLLTLLRRQPHLAASNPEQDLVRVTVGGSAGPARIAG